MFRLLCAVAAFSVVAASPALANDDPKSAPEPVKEKKICKDDSRTGSIMPKRICRTKAEWDEISARSQQDLEKVQSMDRARSVGGITR